MSPVTRLDHAIVNEGEGWTSVNRLEIGTNVFKVKHVGRHTFTVGETIQVITFDKEPTIVEIVGVRLMNPTQLTEQDFQAIGYDDQDAYMHDWGDVFGERVWLYSFRYVGGGAIPAKVG